MASGRPRSGPRPPRRFGGLPWTTAAGCRVRVADRPLARLLGLALLDREHAGPGLLIPRCRSVHTLGMRFALDVAFLDRDGAVVSRRSAVSPGRLIVERRATAVLELPATSSPGGAAETVQVDAAVVNLTHGWIVD